MRILHISDIHGNTLCLEEILMREEYDVVVVSGDITDFGTVDEAKWILEFIYKLSGKIVMFVPGNCDPYRLLNIEFKDKPIINLHEKVYQLGKYKFVGFGGSNITPFYSEIEFSDNEIESRLREILSSIAGDPMFLVTHAPARNTLDVVRSGRRVGSEGLRRILDDFKPLVHACGHIHESPGVMRYGTTLVVNPGPVFLKKYAIIDLTRTGVSAEVKVLR